MRYIGVFILAAILYWGMVIEPYKPSIRSVIETRFESKLEPGKIYQIRGIFVHEDTTEIRLIATEVIPSYNSGLQEIGEEIMSIKDENLRK